MKVKAILILLIAALLISALPACAEENAWTNILLLGGDSRSTEAYERTDTMIILSVNHDERLVKMTSIMRDTWVEFPGKGFSGKINAANVYGGPELALETVNQNFSMDIDRYVLINMADLVAIIDLVGGVDIEITESELKWINSYAQDYLNNVQSYSGQTSLNESGMVHLNGLLATAYTRNRYTDSDYGRVMRQQKVLIALAERMQNTELDEMMAIVDDILDHIQTNLSDEELHALAETGMICDIEEIAQFRIPADGTFQSGMHNGTWKIRPNYSKNSALLKDFIYGEGE